MQPLIHGIYSISTSSENRRDLDEAIHAFREHYAQLLKESPEYPPIADGAPMLTEEAGGLMFSTTDEFWFYEIKLDFWKNLAEKFPRLNISIYYGSVFIGEKCGMVCSEDGKVKDIRYEDGTPDAIEFSKGINGLEGEDLGDD